MLKRERQNKILKMLSKYNFLTVNELAKKLSVSEMTIRRDVTELNDEDKLIKLYGGAQRKNTLSKELSTEEKISDNVPEKKYIGKIMNTVINDDDTIYIGAGTTIYYALSEINKKNLTVITNSRLAFDYLIANTSYVIILSGGEYYRNTEEFIGEIAERVFEDININVGFAATNGLFMDRVTTANSLEGSIQKKAFSKSLKKVVVADHSKFNVTDMYTFYKLSDIDMVITDNQIDDKIKERYSQYTKIVKEPISS